MSSNATIVFIPHGGGPLPLLNEPGHAAMNRFLLGFPATIEKPRDCRHQCLLGRTGDCYHRRRFATAVVRLLWIPR